MLAIEIELLTGRYIATAYNTRLESEWPPHPARLYSALVATHFASEKPALEERAALEWLEAQGAPSIEASEASHREVTTVFVPVNDSAMTNVDAEADALGGAQLGLEAALTLGPAEAIKGATANVKDAQKCLSAAIERSLAAPKPSANPAAAMKVLPEGRVRQPRTFPSVTPFNPCVTYVWPSATPTSLDRAAIADLLPRVVRLGHSSSLVAARLVDREVTPVWRPTSSGERVFRTVQAGQLDALERGFALHREAEPRVMPARFERYTRCRPVEVPDIPRSAFSEDWLVFRRVGGPSPPMVACVGVARTLRKALLSHADQIPEVLSGHAVGGAPTERNHLAIVPLPFVGHENASGSILGAALILPTDTSEEDRRAIYTAVNAWERAYREEDEDAPHLPLTLGAVGVLELERVEWGAVPASLRSTTWCQPSTVWSSVTPVALDRNPGELRSRNREKLAMAIDEAAETVRRACLRIALPMPLRVEILPAAPWAVAAKAKHYPHFPEVPGRTRRVLTHVRLEFAERVRGPILLGAGRYLGLGLLRPEVDGG